MASDQGPFLLQAQGPGPTRRFNVSENKGGSEYYPAWIYSCLDQRGCKRERFMYFLDFMCYLWPMKATVPWATEVMRWPCF